MKKTTPWRITIFGTFAILFTGLGCGKENPVVDDPVVAEPTFWERTMGPGGGTFLALTSNAKGYLFAGAAPEGEIFRSQDDGDNWESVYRGGSSYVTCFTVDARDRLLAGTSSSGVLRSANDGENWSTLKNGLPTYLTGSYKKIYSLEVS